MPGAAYPPCLGGIKHTAINSIMQPAKLNRPISCVLGIAFSTALGLLAASQGHSAEPDQVDFNRSIRPLLNEHCVACHGGVKQAADLSFVYHDQALSVIEPGAPEDSYFLERILSSDEEERMPPPEHGRGLNADEIELLTRWIQQGAAWGQHWAFAAPQPTEPAAIKDDSWSRGRVDRFVLARLVTASLKPNPEASPERWLRRVSLDLTGLPPTPQERESFLQSVQTDREAAYNDVVDRLLNSPSFGEKWASGWLDSVRYADSRGLGIDGRRNIWKYRDWVIKSLNQDMPYDEFTIKQLAGDLLENPSMDDLVATACNRLTQTNEEGGTDDEQFRVEAVLDRVNTTWQTWQGLSFGCVQCHSHPYDPIRHDEYYSFLAFFNNTADCDLSDDAPTLAVPLDESAVQEAIGLDRSIAELWQKRWEAAQAIHPTAGWLPLTGLEAKTDNSTKVVVTQVEGVEEVQTRGTVAKSTKLIVEAEIPPGLTQLTALQFTGLPKDPESALTDSEWGFVISNIKLELIAPQTSAEADTSAEAETVAEPRVIELAHVISDEAQPLMDPNDSLNAKSQSGFGAYSRIHYPRTGIFLTQLPEQIEPGTRIRISVGQNVFALGAFPLVAPRCHFAVSGDSRWTDWQTGEDEAQVLAEIAKLKKQRRAIKSVATPIVVERPASLARPTRVFERGNYLTKTDPVTPGTPSFLPAMRLDGDAPANRLTLARWIASRENPLTARVAVNRVWAQLFGIGIVETLEDFGSSGAPPSHPGLLDDLAVRFQTQMGWSLKSLLHELVLSATYRQSAAVDATKLAADPRNRLIGRGPRNRMPAEVVRDQALAIAGLLNPTQYGPPVHPPIPDGVWKPFQGGDKWATAGKDDPDRYRRTIYTYTKRSIPFPLMASFDAPSRESCTVRRLPSNTPLQALMTLNDQTFVEAAQALAQRMLESHTKLKQQLRHGILLAACRTPREDEVAALQDLYLATLADNQSQEAPESVAMQAVASVLLNLDEVLTQ